MKIGSRDLPESFLQANVSTLSNATGAKTTPENEETQFTKVSTFSAFIIYSHL